MMAVKIKHYKIRRPSRLRALPVLLFRLRWYLPTLLLLALALAARFFPGTVEKVFSQGWYPLVARTYGMFTSLFPFSLLEAGVFLLALLAVRLLVHGMGKWLRREPLKRYWLSILKWIGRGASLTVAVFMLFCGFNYYRPSFAQTSGLPIRESSLQELYALCEELTQQANALRAQLPEDRLGVMQLSEGSHGLAKQARQVFAGLSEEYDILPAYHITPKPVFCSWAMSLMQITGVFCPVTFEANVNTDAPDYSIPATMCHELAHTRGFMREDEANFIGYLACINNDSPEFRYSGIMLALVHAQNRLYDGDRELFAEQASHLSEGVLRDFAYNNAYWARFEGPVGEVSTAVNNTYLQLNAQTDGVQSYGRMVDLLLADYRVRHGLD